MDAVQAELFEGIRRELEARPILAKRFLDAWREERGWTGSYAQARRRLAQWLSDDDPHEFPLAALPILIRVLGTARFLDGLLALEQRVQREQRANAARGSSDHLASARGA